MIRETDIIARGKNGMQYANKRYLGEHIRDNLGTTDRVLAERRLAKLMDEVERGDYQLSRKKWDEVEADYLKEDGRYDWIVRKHLRPYFSGVRILDITSYDSQTGKSMVTEYLREMENLPETSLKRHARVLRCILTGRWQKDGVIKRGFHSFELPEIACRNKGFYQSRFLKVEEFELILSHLHQKYHAVAITMAYTGLDLTPAIDLRWSVVDLKARMIRTKRGKTGIRVDVPITDVVLGVLRPKFRVRNLYDDRVFSISKWSFKKAWVKARDKAGLDWNVRIKDLRHFFASYMLNRGVDHLTVAALMGHSSVNMLRQRYGHFDDESLKKAVSVFDGCTQTVHKTGSKK